MSCRLSLFGPPLVLDNQGKPAALPAKTFALVAYILLSGGGAPTSRPVLRQFLWGNSDAKTSATNLRKFLTRVRTHQDKAGITLIRAEQGHVEVATDCARIDLVRFLEIVSAPASPSELVEICDIYRGDLLEGFAWEETDFHTWLQLQRTKLRDAFITAIVDRIEPIEGSIDRVPLRIAARRLIEVDPFNETAHRTLMRLFAEESEPARVRETYESLETRLREELGVSPDPSTTELYHALLPRRGPGTDDHRDQPLLSRPAAVPGPTLTPLTEPLPPAEPIAGPLLHAARGGLPRITVLPPPPIQGQDYHHQVAASLIEDVTIGLCRFKALSVVAPHTAWQLRARNAELETFDIDYAVETRLLNRGGELWLSVKLISVASRNIEWTEQYELTGESLAERYRELSVGIVQLVIDRVERAELAAYEVETDPTAYQYYLIGQRYLRALDLPNVRRARRAFRAAIGSSPTFVPALAGQARTYQLEWLLMARGDRELLDEAERLAALSLEIDPDDARGHRELGICKLFAGRFDESIDALAKGEQHNPQYADLIADYADTLSHCGEPALALDKIHRAIELNPLCPDQYWWTASGANYHLQRYNAAIECVSHMRDKSPAHRLMAASWAMLGDRRKAREYVSLTKEIHPDFRVNGWLSILPIRDQTIAKHYEEGLREAGFE